MLEIVKKTNFNIKKPDIIEFYLEWGFLTAMPLPTDSYINLLVQIKINFVQHLFL